MVEVSLIPKKERGPVDLNSIFFISGMILLILVVSVSLTLSFYKRNLEKNLQELILTQKNLEENRDVIFEKNVLAVRDDLNNAKKLLDIHSAPTKIFKLLEEIAYPRVQFLSANIDFGRKTIVLGAGAENFEALDAQRSILKNRPELEKSEIVNVALGEKGEVGFTINLYLKPDFLRYSQ